MKTNENSSVIAGLDLGTNASSLAMLDENSQSVAMKNKECQVSTRSAVAFPPGAPCIIGQDALNAGLLYPDRVAREMKLHIGEKDSQGNDVLMVLDSNDNPLTPAQVQGIVARKLIDDANAQVPRPITDVVLSVPANYGNRERQAIMSIENQIGCRIIALIEEPVAVACTFINMCKPGDGHYLVFDVGAGTTDLTDLEVSGANPRIHVTKGKANLGGRRCDMALIEVITKIAKDNGIDIAAAQDPATLHEFHEKVERAKITLTQAEKALFYMNFEGKILKTDLRRIDFEKACAPILAEMKELAQETIAVAKLSPSELKGILPNGPSCLMPMIVAMLAELFPGVPLRREIDPITAVAQGAALMGAKYAQQDGKQAISRAGTTLRALDNVATVRAVATHGLGCLYLVNGNRDAKAFAVIIPPNTPLPATKSDKFALVDARQTAADVEVFQGEENMPIDQCVQVATVRLEGIPAGPNDVPRIVVQYAYNRSGIVEVTISDTISNKTVSSNVTHDMGNV
jgi:molecular chaperone DnaK